VLGHDHVAKYLKVVAEPHGFERALEEVAGAWNAEVGLPSKTTESEEVGVPGGLITDQPSRHGGIVRQTTVGGVRFQRLDQALGDPHLKIEMWRTPVVSFQTWATRRLVLCR